MPSEREKTSEASMVVSDEVHASAPELGKMPGLIRTMNRVAVNDESALSVHR